VLGVVTSDDPQGTELCLKGLGIDGCFDLILASDRVHPSKPDPYYMYEFCKKFSLRPEEVMMVGDTLADMQFGKNSGTFTVGVAKLRENRDFIAPYADCVIRDVSALPELLSEKQGE
jgi:phosphoglycolate phosphatase